MQFPIFIELRRSRLLDFSLCLAHAVAAACVGILLPSPFLLLLGPVAVSAYFSFHREQFASLRLSEQGRLDCVLADGSVRECIILPDSTVFGSLVVLRLMTRKGATRPFHLVLLPDQMPPTQFRRLVLWLQWRVRADATMNA